MDGYAVYEVLARDGPGFALARRKPCDTAPSRALATPGTITLPAAVAV